MYFLMKGMVFRGPNKPFETADIKLFSWQGSEGVLSAFWGTGDVNLIKTDPTGRGLQFP